MKIAVFTCTLLLGLAAVTFAQVKPKADIVYVNSRGDEKTEDGVYVNEWTWSGVDVKLRAGNRRFSADEILSVKFTRPPTGFEEAKAAFDNGDYRTSIESFQNLLESDLKDSEAWAAEQARYYLWASFRGVGAYNDADQQTAELKKLAPKSPFLPEIIVQEAEDILGLGDTERAVKLFAETSDKAKTQNWATKYRILSDLGRIRGLIAMKKTSEADALFNQVIGTISVPAMNQRAQILRGEILVASDKIDDAKAHYSKLFNDVKGDWQKNASVFAGAANGLGDCYFEKGDWKQAAEEYSKTFALFEGNRTLENEVAWAIWRFANANKQMAAKEQDAELAREYRGRYERLRRRVAQDFRMTRAGQLSRRELGVSE